MKPAEQLIVLGATVSIGYLIWISLDRDDEAPKGKAPGDGPDEAPESDEYNPRIWPVPAMVTGRKPVISSGHKDENPSRPTHHGADVMFRRYSGDTQGIGDGKGAKRFVMPPDTPIVATEDGIVQLASKIGTGHRVWLNHHEYRTGYFHLSKLFVKKGQTVSMGDKLGIVGHNPIAHDALHLHFALSAADGSATFNPGPYLRGAKVLSGKTAGLWVPLKTAA